MPKKGANEQWVDIIEARNTIFRLDLRAIWNYRDLLSILIRRDILSIYKQTVLGPIWFFLQPLLTTFVYILVFSRIILPSDTGIPPVLFYLSGLILWSYFSECVLRTSTFFRDNKQMLSKVYFPRLIVPLAIVTTNLVRLSIQFVLFFLFYFYFLSRGTIQGPNSYAFLLPVLILIIAGLGLGSGMIVASLTTKYKDLLHLVSFGIQLMMFTAPVLFPLGRFKSVGLQRVIAANPMSGLIEAFRFGFLGKGTMNWQLIGYDLAVTLLVLVLGLVIFNAVERDFADTI
jgi:lipopolysaccharide transport system permease protein